MNPERRFLVIAFAVCFVLAVCAGFSFSQKAAGGSDHKLLAEFERRIESSDLTGLDEPLMNFVIANPINAKALELLARLRSKQGRLPESRSLYQRVMQLDPKAAGARIHAARIAYLSGQKDEALQLLSGVSASELNSTQQMELSATYLLAGDLQAAVRIAEGLPPQVRNTVGLPLLGEIYLRQNRPGAVRELFPLMKKAAAKDPQFALSCAEALRGAGSVKEGIELLSSLPLSARNNVRVLLMLSRLEIMSDDMVRARQHLAQAARLDPNSADVLSMQAFVQNSAGNRDRALQLITKARESAPRSPTVLADFIALTLRIGKPDAAYEAAQTLNTLQPDDPGSQYLLGVAALQNGNFGPARETLERYVLSRPSDFRGCLALGTVFRVQRETARARRELIRCNELDPTNAEARMQLGLLYKAEGENKQAIGMLEEVVSRAPNHTLALRELGALYLESGDDVKASSMLSRAAQLAPGDADIHFQLIRLYNRTGETTLAKQHQEIFQKLKAQQGKSAQ